MERKPRGAARLLPPLALGVLGLLALGASFVAPARGYWMMRVKSRELM